MTASALPLPVVDSHVPRLKRLLEARPLYIIIETTNICNARCVFCAYPRMKRAKGVMAPELFAKVIRDYADMGGGAVSLTPIVGDVLLDPLLPQRLEVLADTPSITDVSFVTNGIAWRRWSACVREQIARTAGTISISLGGLDRASYEAMFAVDRYEAVRAAIHDLCDLKARLDLPLQINLNFRVNRPVDELLADPRMDEFRRPQINGISAINSFANWGGVIRADDLPAGAALVPLGGAEDLMRLRRRNPCFVHYTSPEITFTGLVSACGCMNAEAEALILGDLTRDSLRDIWTGAARRGLMRSFGTPDLPEICARCTYYADGEDWLRQPALANYQPGQNPWHVLTQHAQPPQDLLRAALEAMTAEGYRCIGLYGAGAFTRQATSPGGVDLARYAVRAVIDDNPALHGAPISGVRVISRAESLREGLDAVLLSSDHFTPALWVAAAPLREAGIHVRALAACREAESGAAISGG